MLWIFRPTSVRALGHDRDNPTPPVS